MQCGRGGTSVAPRFSMAEILLPASSGHSGSVSENPNRVHVAAEEALSPRHCTVVNLTAGALSSGGTRRAAWEGAQRARSAAQHFPQRLEGHYSPLKSISYVLTQDIYCGLLLISSAVSRPASFGPGATAGRSVISSNDRRQLLPNAHYAPKEPQCTGLLKTDGHAANAGLRRSSHSAPDVTSGNTSLQHIEVGKQIVVEGPALLQLLEGISHSDGPTGEFCGRPGGTTMDAQKALPAQAASDFKLSHLPL